jgi:hypothetical protein
VRTPGGTDGIAQRIAQKVITGFWLDGHEFIGMCRFQQLPEARLINAFGAADEIVELLGRH